MSSKIKRKKFYCCSNSRILKFRRKPPQKIVNTNVYFLPVYKPQQSQGYVSKIYLRLQGEQKNSPILSYEAVQIVLNSQREKKNKGEEPTNTQDNLTVFFFKLLQKYL
eukprot:TRINITY_DN6275_c2_g1_i5.p4 TRINITY_DN6275_c2_g1~~TRINITY_DN6275_c2_g1_i5.p4  ORF type:complete len:108 (-),score=1.19 TRINITY_DN6275_c2_g1_i5:101-424(-)